MAEVQEDQEFVEMVVKAIVEFPDKVKTERSVDERGVLIELTVDPADMGKIIGKEGRTAKSIRTLLRVLGAKSNARVNLKIVEPEGSTGPTRKPEYDDEAKEDKVEESKDSEIPADSASEEKAEEEVKEDKIEEKEKVKTDDDDIPTDVLA